MMCFHSQELACTFLSAWNSLPLPHLTNSDSSCESQLPRHFLQEASLTSKRLHPQVTKVPLQHILGYYCSSPTSISGSSLPQQDCILFTLIFLRPDIHQTLPVDKNILEISITLKGFPWWLSGKESSCQCRRHGFDSWVGKIPWRVKWQPTPVFLPEKFHAQRSLWGLQSIGSQRVRHDIATKWRQQITLREASAFLSLELFLAVSKMLTHVFPWFPFSFFSSHNPPSCLSNPY